MPCARARPHALRPCARQPRGCHLNYERERDLPNRIPFLLNDLKFLEILIKSLRVHWSTCVPHEDYQLNLPPSILTFRVFCYFFEISDEDHECAEEWAEGWKEEGEASVIFYGFLIFLWCRVTGEMVMISFICSCRNKKSAQRYIPRGYFPK
jgi:hypothetical protein